MPNALLFLISLYTVSSNTQFIYYTHTVLYLRIRLRGAVFGVRYLIASPKPLNFDYSFWTVFPGAFYPDSDGFPGSHRLFKALGRFSQAPRYPDGLFPGFFPDFGRFSRDLVHHGPSNHTRCRTTP